MNAFLFLHVLLFYKKLYNIFPANMSYNATAYSVHTDMKPKKAVFSKSVHCWLRCVGVVVDYE